MISDRGKKNHFSSSNNMFSKKRDVFPSFLCLFSDFCLTLIREIYKGEVNFCHSSLANPCLVIIKTNPFKKHKDSHLLNNLTHLVSVENHQLTKGQKTHSSQITLGQNERHICQNWVKNWAFLFSVISKFLNFSISARLEKPD